MTDRAAPRQAPLEGRGAAFLASQVGSHSSRLWNQRVEAIGLDSRQAMLLWNVALWEGRSQRQLATVLHLPGSRIVELVDSLEAQGCLERRISSGDRRTRELHLTRSGRALVDRITDIAVEHEDDLMRGLEQPERASLVALLTKVARAQGLIPTVHPDF